jgi:histidyl-tRNA synthetase
MSLSTLPYKGTRDFYPKDSIINQDSKTDYMVYQRYIVDMWRSTMISLGFDEYDASIIESADIYLAKSGEELGSKQLYNFTDKGGREIALRPEMTPSLARMVAAKEQNLRYPLRWFSIPNCFRYEATQKGRSREFWQLNVDIVGADGEEFSNEIIFVANEVMKAFGEPNFEILVGNRKLLDKFIIEKSLTEKSTEIYKLLDDWKKLANNHSRKTFALETGLTENEFELCLGFVENKSNFSGLFQAENVKSIVRGLAYYTGIVFEAFDLNLDNSRALLGGGAYTNLMELFGGKKVNCLGFGMGDAVLFEYLKFWKLLDGHPNFEQWKKQNYPEKVGIMLINQSPENIKNMYDVILPKLRIENKTWDIDYDIDRSENKRYESLKKRGCTEIIKV